MKGSVLDFQLSSSVRARIAESGLSFANFLELAQSVKNLPYARCAPSDDPYQVLTDRRGTCSSKHRLRAGCGNLNTAISEKAAPMGEDRARKDWSGNEQKTPAQPLCDLQGEGGG